jgi:hypothetical protein
MNSRDNMGRSMLDDVLETAKRLGVLDPPKFDCALLLESQWLVIKASIPQTLIPPPPFSTLRFAGLEVIVAKSHGELLVRYYELRSAGRKPFVLGSSSEATSK